jgi:hypothetical protein
MNGESRRWKKKKQEGKGKGKGAQAAPITSKDDEEPA